MPIHRRPWGSQPEPPVAINPNSPQANGLVWYPALHDPGLADLTDSRLVATNSGATLVPGEPFDGRAFNGSSDIRATPTSRIVNATAWTACCFVRFSSFASAYNTVLSASGAGGSPNGYRDLHVKSNGKLACYVDASSSVFYDGTGVATLTAWVLYHLALTYSSDAGLTGYVNAVVDGTAGAFGNLAALTAPSLITVGNNPPNFATRFINAAVFDARFYDRALTAAEIREVYENPGELFAPRPIWVPVSAGSAPVTSTTSLSAAIQAAAQATASAGLAVQTSPVASTSLALAAQAAQQQQAALALAVRDTRSATTAVAAAVQATGTQSASLGAVVQALRTATSVLELTVQAQRTATVGVDMQVQAGSTISVSLAAAVLRQATAAAGLDVPVQTTPATAVSLGAALQLARQAAATIDAAVQAARTQTVGLSLQVQAGTTLLAQLDAAVQEARAATASVQLAVAATGSAQLGLAAAVALQRSLAAAMAAAVLQARSAGFGAALYVLDDSPAPPRLAEVLIYRVPAEQRIHTLPRERRIWDAS